MDTNTTTPKKRRSAPCTQTALCKRKHQQCDGCQRWVHQVRACGRDAAGDPDAPDLCIRCEHNPPGY